MSTINTIRTATLRSLAFLAPALLGACSMFGGGSHASASTTAGGAGPAQGAAIDLGKVRADLSQLEADPQLAPRAPAAIKEAEQAVAEAQGTQRDQERYAHLTYIADRKVQTARALAESKVADDQLKNLRGQ